MADKMFRTFRAEVKEVNAEAGIIDMFIPMSTGTLDRLKEVIMPSAFKKTLKEFNKRPILLSSHDYHDLRKQIGEFQSLKLTEDGLMAKPRYYIGEGNEEADWGFKLAQKGMAAFSVGFIPLKIKYAENEKDPLRTYEELELLEISQVVVPANREAIQGVRAKSVDTVLNQFFDDVLKTDIVPAIVTKPEETENYYRVPVPKEEGKHEGHRIRRIYISKEKGIRALYCGQDKVNITYLFDKEKWDSLKEAEAWVKDHEKGFSQAEIRDELDYVKSIIESGNLSEENRGLIRELLPGMRTASGQKQMDMADCIEMAGECKALLDKMISAMGDMTEEESKGVPGGHMPDKIDLLEAIKELYAKK